MIELHRLGAGTAPFHLNPDLIVTQRGFQANSRVITNSDEMLQEVVNLKR